VLDCIAVFRDLPLRVENVFNHSLYSKKFSESEDHGDLLVIVESLFDWLTVFMKLRCYFDLELCDVFKRSEFESYN